MNNKKNILILGGYGYGNTGDEAQLNETLNIIKKYFYGYNIIVLTPNLEYTKNTHDCNVDYAPREAFFNSQSDPNTIYWIKNADEEEKMKQQMKSIYFQSCIKKYLHLRIKNKKIDHLIDLLKSASLVYYCGGGYLTGDTLSRLFDGCLFISLCKLFKVPVVLSGQTIGLFRNDFDRKISKRAFSYTKLITLRDPVDSAKALDEIGINNYEVMFDDALFCEKETNKHVINKLLEKAGMQNRETYITFHMHHWGINSEEKKKVVLDKLKLIIEYTQEIFENVPILLIPMTPSDYNEQKEFLEYISKRNIYLLEYDYDFKKIRSIIGNSILCITMKHHPIIFAVGEKVPIISTSYSEYYKHKNTGALKIFGLEKYNIELESDNCIELYKNIVVDIKENYEQNKKYLDELFISLKIKKEEFIFKVKSRAEQSRANLFYTYFYLYNNTKNKKIQPMLQYSIVA